MRTLRHSLSQALFVAVIPALASSAALVGCSSASSSSAPSTPVDTGTAVGASVTRDLNPTVSSADSASIVASNTDFAFALYHGLSTGDGGSTTGNLFYSPYSVSLALAMTYAGAHGATATQMARALQFKLPPARLNPAFDLLDLAIQATPTHASGADGAPFAINVADSLWGGGEVSFKPSFVDTLAANYGAPLRTVDFGGDPAGAETTSTPGSRAKRTTRSTGSSRPRSSNRRPSS
jgi:serpin B